MGELVAGAPALRLDSVSFSYGRRRVLHGLTGQTTVGAVSTPHLRAAGGPHVVALLGQNGAGKTSLLRLLSSEASPVEGVVEVGSWSSAGDRAMRRSYRAKLGMVPQRLDLASSYSCEDTLRYACWLKQVPARAVPGAVASALEQFDLTDRARSKVWSLSGGMRQRLCLAQAVVNDPAVVILDEPTVGLDPKQRVEVRHYLRSMPAGTLVVLATHLVEDVASLATEVVFLDDGRIGYWGDLRGFCTGAEVAVADGTAPDGTAVETAFLRRLQTAEKDAPDGT